MKRISEKKINIFYIVTGVLLLLVLTILYFNSRKVKSTNNLVEQTQEVLRLSDNVLLDVLNMSIGTRGYLLTGNKILLEPYDIAIPEIRSNLEALDLLTIDNEKQHLRIDSLKTMIDERLNLSIKMIEDWQENELLETEKLEIIGLGKIRNDKIRDIIADFNSEEFFQLKQRKIENEKSEKDSELIFLILIIFILVIFGLVVIILAKQRFRSKDLRAFTAAQKHASQYTRSLIEANLDPLVTISAEGKITDVNEASVIVTGVTRENLIGTNFSDYFTDPTKAQEGYLQVFENGFVSDYPLTIKHKNGNLTDVLYNASVYKNDKGEVLGVFAAARDVTAQKLLSKYSLSLIEASLDPLVTINTEGKITDMNEATVNITGVEREKLKGTDFFDYFTESEQAREVYQEVFANGTVTNFPLILRHKDGNLTDVLFNGSVYKDDQGNVLGAVVVARDVTVQKWATKLRNANEELALQNSLNEKWAADLVIANKELAFQNDEKEKRAAELIIANKELIFQNDEKEKRAAELIIANEKADRVEKELKNAQKIASVGSWYFDINTNKVSWSEELYKMYGFNPLLPAPPFPEQEKIFAAKSWDILSASIANILETGIPYELELETLKKDGSIGWIWVRGETVLDKENKIYGLWGAAQDITVRKQSEIELLFQNEEKEKRAAELVIANKELAIQNDVKEKRAAELIIANEELAFQNEEKEKRAAELVIANKELAFQNDEKEQRAAELIIANKELAFQNDEKGKRADELSIANKELAFQNGEKEKRAAELIIANKELAFQNKEKGKRADELSIANKELAFQNDEKEKRANELILANKELVIQNREKEKRAKELIIADSELVYQTREKEKSEFANLELEAISDSLKLASQYSLSLLEASLDPLVTISAKGKITDMNEALANITGMSRAELTGTDFLDYFTEPQKAREVYLEVFEKGSVADSPLTIRHKNGKLTDVLFNGSVYKDDRGNVIGIVIVARDVTAQKLLSKYSLSLIEASLDPLVTINTEGKITDINDATVNITGVEREKLKGTDFFDYFTEPQKAREVYLEVFAKGSVADSPLTLRHKNGKLTDVLFNGSVYKDDHGNVLGVVIVARDVTDQKRIATELTEAIVFAEMATLIAEEAKSKAESAAIIAEDAVKAKQQFLSNMSHEIRTPMNAIIGFTKVVLKTELSVKQKEYLQAIKLSGDSLIVLINDILDLAKVDAGKMIFEKVPFKIALSLSAMLHLFEPKIQEKNLKFTKEYDSRIPEVLLGDPVRLHQIILNLVSNAVKFTTRGKITVSVNLVDEDAEKVCIKFAVSDTGIGIPESKIEKIFENFQQASSGTSRLYGGTGLGLAIVKQLVEAQGGSIQVSSKINEGSNFSFQLDFQKTNAKTELNIEQVELDNEATNINVLVVEDIALNQLLMRTLLDDFGFECDIADNGKIAIDKMKTKSYDIILMDLQMPEMNGFEATDYIRNIMNSDIPIIALTADVTTVDLAKCTAVGMNDYIAKPVDERVLYRKMIGLVKKDSLVIDPEVSVLDKTILVKCTNLEYLNIRTKSNRILMMEMISIYLKQTPPLISSMKKGLREKDLDTLYSAVHKMIPSFSIMGISHDFEDMAKKVQDYASNPQNSDGIPDMVLQLENVCEQACVELQEEYDTIKNNI